MKRVLLAAVAVLVLATALVVSHSGTTRATRAGIFCPIYPQPVQTVMHIVCTA